MNTNGTRNAHKTAPLSLLERRRDSCGSSRMQLTGVESYTMYYLPFLCFRQTFFQQEEPISRQVADRTFSPSHRAFRSWPYGNGVGWAYSGAGPSRSLSDRSHTFTEGRAFAISRLTSFRRIESDLWH